MDIYGRSWNLQAATEHRAPTRGALRRPDPARPGGTDVAGCGRTPESCCGWSPTTLAWPGLVVQPVTVALRNFLARGDIPGSVRSCAFARRHRSQLPHLLHRVRRRPVGAGADAGPRDADPGPRSSTLPGTPADVSFDRSTSLTSSDRDTRRGSNGAGALTVNCLGKGRSSPPAPLLILCSELCSTTVNFSPPRTLPREAFRVSSSPVAHNCALMSWIGRASC